jgi:hypothetical protein
MKEGRKERKKEKKGRKKETILKQVSGITKKNKNKKP